ncbi:Vacuolar protein sorting-associated protein 13A [Phytophthora pseudosyringae]|uniref:Vacuolar protein sorting-associated protein 13A n=1 Tax=Phytophthora pseudosyringae TaxID=221518 RepID=A0A8T1WEI9_9STRA|nr:Vacuolar protein sorting-associated protein 13A [Phytophthora pseudosyringae]
MFLQRYVHVVLDAVLGSYVKNIDPAALQISVWNGKIEVEAVELQPDAFPLPRQMRLVKGTLRQLRIDLPWTNLAGQPIRVDIQDVSLLLEVCADDRAACDGDLAPDEQRQKLHTLQRKRAALDAVEKATEFNEKSKTQAPAGQSWTQSFLFKLLVKVLDNVQVHVQHLHLRMEDAVSDPRHPYAVGMTLEAIIVKSADEGWNYTMVGRGQQAQDGVSFIRKKMDINKLGVYWSLPLMPVPATVLSDAETFATLMRSNFSTEKPVEEVLEPSPSPPTSACFAPGMTKSPPLFKPSDYIVHPLTVSMKLTVNDGHAKLPITHQELSERVLSRLGTPWMVETIDAIGDEAWSEFLDMMPKLAGERKYTLGFVFSEAWSVARDLTEEEDEIPSVGQFKEALSSCMQWSLEEVDGVEPCIVKYREAVVHVMEEKSTYIDAQASIDQISTSLHRQQYLSALSFISFLTVKRRQARYLGLRPKRIRVKDNPGAWWKYAVNAVLLDVRERLAHVDWESLEKKRQQRNRYKDLYLVLAHGTTFAASLVSPDLRLLSKEMARNELDELEFVIDVQELIKLRRSVRNDIAEKEKEKEVLSKLQAQRESEEGMPSSQGPEVPSSSRLWSYATWLTGAGGAAQGDGTGSLRSGEIRVEDVKWSDQDTKELYKAIDFHPEEDDKESRVSESGEVEDADVRKKRLLQEHQHILYRFQLTLCKASFGLSLEDVPGDLSGFTLHEGAGKMIPTKATSASHLIASLDDVEIQFLVRPSCQEVGLQLRDAFFCQSSRSSAHDRQWHRRRSVSSSGTDVFLQRMDMDEILEYHPVGVRNQMSSVRLRHCERELPLMQLSIESERQPKLDGDSDSKREPSTDDATAAQLLRVSFVTQPIKCNVNLMFLLDVVAVFSRPVNVDLSGLEHSAWRRAQSLQRYSAAQLRDALARRTKVDMRLDVISPLINIIQSPPGETGIPKGDEVSLLVFLGHLKAQTKHPSDIFDEADISSDFEEKKETGSRMIAASPEESLYDVLEISISGIEVQTIDGGNSGMGRGVFRTRNHTSKTSAWHYLLEKTSLTFSFYMSVTPDDPSIPLLKFFGGVDSVKLNLSATSFRSLMQLLHSFGENFSVHAQRRIDRDAASATDVASQHSTRIGPLTTGTPRRSKPKLVRKTSSYVNPGAVALSSSGSSGRPAAASENSPYLGLARKIQLERKKTFREKDIDDQDLLKLWKRVICHLQFGVGEITLTLQVRDMENSSGKIVRVRAVDINTRLKVRSYDRRLEFALGTFLVEDILLTRPSPSSKVVEKKRFLMKSGNHEVVTDLEEKSEEGSTPSVKPPPSSEQLIHVAITSIASDAEMLKDKSMWKHARHSPLSPTSDKNSVWQDPLITTLSVDASLRVLTIDVYQDTLAEVFVFFFKHNNEESEGCASEQPLPPPPPSLRSVSEGSTASRKRLTGDMDEQSVLSSVDTEANEDTFSRKLGVWMASSFLDNVPAPGPEKEYDPDDSITKDTNDDVEDESPASMQLRLHVEGLALFLHLDDKQRPDGIPSAFATLSAQQFCCCVQRFPRYLSMFAYLTSLKICDVSLLDQHLTEIVSHGSTSPEPKEDKVWINRDDTREYDGDIAVDHVPTLSEILLLLDDVPAVFSCAAQFYGADSIQEAWHPGYSSRYSVRLKSPRIRFLYSFVDDMRNYWMKGVLLQTVLAILSREQADMLWEGDFQLADLQGGPAQTQLNTEEDEDEKEDGVTSDTVLEMPPHRMSSESLLLRFDNFRASNEGVVNSFLGMENRIVAKVLLNSSLKQLQLDMKSLRIVSVILVDRNDVDKQQGGGGFITQSLLGLTDFSLSVDFRSHADLKLNLNYSPVRLVCNQEQYAFVLRVPFQNYRERSRYHFSQEVVDTSARLVARTTSRRVSLSRSLDGGASSSGRIVEDGDEASNGASVPEVLEAAEERHIMLDLHVPEITMELLQGQHGYHPSSSGDLDMAEKGKTNHGSICVLALSVLSGRADYNLANGRLTADVDLEGVHVRDSRVNSKMSVSYRDVVVFERCKEGLPKAIKIQFGRESFDVDVSTIGFDPAFSTHGSGLRTPRTQFRSVSSRAIVGLFGSELSLRRTDSEMSAYSPMSSTVTSHGAHSDKSGEEKTPPVVGTEGRMDLVVDVAGFKVIPSNIHYDVIQFLTMPPDWNADDEGSVSSRGETKHSEEDGYAVPDETTTVPPVYRRISLELNVGPSALLLVEDPHMLKSRALMLSWESSVIINYLRQTNEDECPNVKDKGKESPAHSRNQLQFCIALENIHATSRLSEESVWAAEQAATAASADCLKPIDMETVLQMDLQSHFLRFRTTFDRVMELRFGYLDFCTMLAALEHIFRRPVMATQTTAPGGQKRRSMSGSSISSLSGGGPDSETSSWGERRRSPSPPLSGLALSSSKKNERQRVAALYGTSLIYLVSASFRGRLETRPVVGFYNSTWRKRYLVLPYTAQQRQLVQSVAFRILPASGSRRQIGDEIYYGDRIILEAVVDNNSENQEKTAKDKSPSKEESAGTPTAAGRDAATTAAQSTLIRKYDQLGAIGYLGPEGSAGAFETTIWKHGSTMFNSDKSVIYDRELILFEELTIYRSFSKGKKFGAANATGQQMDFNSARSGPQAEGAHTVDTTGARGGGYLMFNGIGDAPIPFALSIVSSKTRSQFPQREEQSSPTVGDTEAVGEDDDTAGAPEIGDTGITEENQPAPARKRRKKRKSLFAYSSFLENLKILEFTLPGVNATVVNDFHNMLLPLLHFRVAMLHADVRGRLEDKFTALTSLRFGIQAYNSQLAVWEPVLEDFEVNMAYHGKGGVLCDYCMSERQSVSPTGAALRCDGMPLCLFRSSRTEVFTNAAAHSWEAKNFIYRELLEQPDVQDGAKLANTFVIVVKDDFNINVSRNVINVLVHFFALVTKVTAADEALSSRLGPFIYVDNQSGIPFVVATHPSSSSNSAPTAGGIPTSSRRPTGSIEMPTEVPGADTNDDIMKAGAAMFNSNAWSRRRLSTMLNDISSSDTKWIRVESGERVATEIVAHEAPAGCVTSPLRRLLWLKPQSHSQRTTSSKAIPVPIGYSNRSYLHLESSGKQRDSWHGESIICETVAEQGTLVLRLRGKVQLTNFFSVPIQVIYNDQREEKIEPGGKAAHYIPIQYLESGTIAFRPLLSNGMVQRSDALSIASLLLSNDSKPRGRSHRRQNVGSLELRKALTFYWDVHPSAVGEDAPDFSFGVSLPPFQVILTALRKSERHETTITLRPPIVLENLVPYELSYRTVCMKSEAEVVWVAKNAASFSGANGKIPSGSSACVAELDILERDMDNGEVMQTPTVVGLSLALPQIQLRRFSRWSRDTFIYGCQSFCERIELNMRDDSELEAPTPANKLTICVEITQLEKLRSRALNTLCPVVCRVFTEYWLIDRTSLSLAFYTADDYLIPSNHPGRLYDDKGDTEGESSSVSLSVFSCESKQVVSKMKIGIKGGKGEREVQSEPFDISAVGVRGQILVPTNRSRDARSLLSTIAEFGAPSDGLKTTFKQYEFGVMIEQGPEKFSRSRVVTLVPRYYFINTSNRFDIRIRQERSTDPSAVIVIRPQETKIFHWSDSRLPSRVQICFVLPDNRHDERDTVSYANSSQWSAPFELSSVGNFVLRVKSKVRPAPPCLPECFEGSATKREQLEDDQESNMFFDEEDEYNDAERMLAEGIQLNVAVELHDPSFLVYLEEGSHSIHFSPPPSYEYEEDDREHTLTVKHKENEGFVPFKIKNECSNLALVVWQKTLVKDDKGNVTIGFEGGEPVLPFHTIDYVPFRFSAFPTVFVQVQKVAGLGIGALRKEHPLHGHRQDKLNTKAQADRGDRGAPVTALTRSASVGQTQVVASFEVQLKKLQHLPTIDVSEGVAKKRLWAEVLLDETTKTLLVTDMLPGFSGEHKRRRRATLLRSWKRYNTSIVFISHVLAAHRAQLTDGSDDDNIQENPAKKKRVRFAVDVTKVVEKHGTDEAGTPRVTQQGGGAGHISPSIEVEKEVEALVLCVRLVDATYLEDVFLQAGRSDLTSCQPFITFSLKTDGEETRTKLAPQSTTMFPRWLPAPNLRAVLSALMLSDEREEKQESSNPEFGAGAEIVVEIREADKILFGSSVIATARIPLQEYCAAAIISARSESNYEPQVVEFLAPVRVARKDGGWSRPVENETRIRFQMCCRRTFTTRSAAAESSGEGRDALDTVKELKDMLSAYQLKKELDVLVSSKAQLKLLLEREAVDTSTSGTNIPAALRSVPDASSGEEKKDSGLSRFVARSTGADDESLGTRSRSTNSVRGSAVSVTTDESTSDGTYEEMGDEKRLTAVLIGVSNLQIPTEIIRNNFKHTHGTTEHLEPKVYCTITYEESTRSALSAVAKSSAPSAAATDQNKPDESGSSPTGRVSMTGPPSSNAHLQQVRTHEFPRGKMLGLDLVYRNGRVLVQGVVCDGPCGGLVYEGKVRIGDTVVAANNKSIVNLHRDASFAVIEKAMHWGEGVGTPTQGQESGATFTLSFLYQPTTPERMTFSDTSRPPCAQTTDEDTGVRKYDAEWNRRVEFVETANTKPAAGSGDEQVLVRVYLRNETSDHGLSASQESSIVPFLYFFGDDAMMDHLDHSKQDSRFDVLLAECWVPLPPSSLSSAGNPMAMDGNPMAEPSALTFNERICALYSPQQRTQQHSALEMIGQLRLALKWDFINPLRAAHQQGDLSLHFQLEVARICISIVDDGAWSSVASAAGPQEPQEVLCISLSDQNASAGVQLSYGQISDGKHVINARIGHFQIDNQLLDTNYPVLLRPIRLLDAQMQEEGYTMAPEKGGKVKTGDEHVESPMLLPTVQLMAVCSRQPNVIQFDYIFGQLQELEIKLEDATLVVLAHVFSGVEWSHSASNTRTSKQKEQPGDEFGSNLALKLLEIEWSTPTLLSTAAGGRLGSTRSGGGANMKVLLRWLLLCPVKVNVTFTSTADRSLLLSLLSPDMSSVLSTLISAAAALVSNLDQAPIRVPEFYVENLLETTHTLAFYAMQHYLHHGLRSWYSIMGSVDFLGNPIGLVSTLGTGVKDFFYTPAQMLLEDENGLRIDNLRTGMTKGSKSLLRNTAVGIFHTTGKITETLGKGIALLAMDEQYNVQRQRASTRQIKKINDLGDAIAEGSKGLVGGVWDGIKGVVAAPVRGAEQDGAGGFVVGIGKGVAGLIVKPTAGFLDLLTSLSRGAKTSAESLDGTDRSAFDTVTRFRLPRRICSDGVLVSYSEREARGYAVLLLTSLDATDDYVYHVDYGIEPHRGLLLLTDKRLICLSGKTGQKLWEVALDSTLDIVVEGVTLRIGQTTSPSRSYNIECDSEVAATNFRVAVDSARVDVSATRYLLLNLEKSQEESRITGSGRFGNGAAGLMNSDEDRTDLHVLMENVQDTTVSGLSNDDLRSQPLRSVRVEVCHLQNKDAHANVPNRGIDKLLSFSVFQVQVYGGPYQWTVFRRFSEFRELCAKLEAAGYVLDGLPPLPPRTFLPSTRAPVAKHRQEALNMFLQAAIMHSVISRSAAMLDFLTREAREVRVSLPPLSPTGEREASQRAGDSP